ncbi:hypothetical protein ES705_19635 [subsurface metagenome]
MQDTGLILRKTRKYQAQVHYIQDDSKRFMLPERSGFGALNVEPGYIRLAI